MNTIKRHEFRYELTTEPETEPVATAEAKLFARIDISDDDALVDALIATARKTVEHWTKRALINQTWTATLDVLPSATSFELANRPISAVTSIKGLNEDGTETTITVADDILVDGSTARVSLLSSADALSSDRSANAFQIVYVAGYGATAADVPEWAKTAIKMLVSTWYENREAIVVGTISAELPVGVKAIINPNMVIEL